MNPRLLALILMYIACCALILVIADIALDRENERMELTCDAKGNCLIPPISITNKEHQP